MLDMAFQLLTFFILTFKPSPVEGKVELRLPPPQAITPTTEPFTSGSKLSETNPVQSVKSLVITAFAQPKGELAALAVGETMLGIDTKLRTLSDKLSSIFADPGNPFEQVIVQVAGDLRYDQLMRVVEVCSQQPLPTTNKLPKLSFVELPDGSDGW